MLNSFLQLLKWYIQQSKASDTAHSCKHQCSGTWRSWRSFLTGCWCLMFALAVLMSDFCSADVRCLQCWWLIFSELMTAICSVDVWFLQYWCPMFAVLVPDICRVDDFYLQCWCLQCWCLVFAVLMSDICSVGDWYLQCWSLMPWICSVDVWCLQCWCLQCWWLILQCWCLTFLVLMFDACSAHFLSCSCCLRRRGDNSCRERHLEGQRHLNNVKMVKMYVSKLHWPVYKYVNMCIELNCI